MEVCLTKRQNELLDLIYKYIKDTGYPPTFDEMREGLNVRSNQSVIDLLFKLEKVGAVKKNSSSARGIAILPLGYRLLNQPALAPYLGAASAGAPVQAIELPGNWMPVSKDLERLMEDVFIMKVNGDSMINAGIDNGDLVLIRPQNEFVSGDIVLANIGDEVTVKRFMSTDAPPYTYLKPENPKYEIILFTDEVSLSGKVISILKKDYWMTIK